MKPMRRRLPLHLIGVFVAAIGAVLLFWALLPAAYRVNDSSDYTWYYEPLARALLRGEGFVELDGLPALRNPPGYAVLLAGVFRAAVLTGLPEPAAHSLFVLLCAGLSAVFVFMLARDIWRGALAGWVAAGLFLSYPFILWLTKQPAAELPFMALLYASLWACWRAARGSGRRWLWCALAGVLAGAAMLVRAIAAGLGLLLAALLMFLAAGARPGKRAALALVLLGACAAVILPWEIHLYRQTGRVVLLGTGGAASMRDGLTYAAAPIGYRSHPRTPPGVLALQKRLLTALAEAETVPEVLRAAAGEMRQAPLAALGFAGLKAARAWFGTDSGRLETYILPVQIVYGVLVLAGTIAAWRRRRAFPGALALAWGTAGYFWLMAVLALSILRYTAPAAGALFLLAPALLPARKPAGPAA